MNCSAKEIIDQLMLKDTFVKWLGIEIINLESGEVTLEMLVTKTMVNGLEIAHGAITYALADTALAFASNSRGNKCVSIETSISHLLPVYINDRIKAVTKEISFNDKIGIYKVSITNQHNIEVARFKGTVFVKEEKW